MTRWVWHPERGKDRRRPRGVRDLGSATNFLCGGFDQALKARAHPCSGRVRGEQDQGAVDIDRD